MILFLILAGVVTIVLSILCVIIESLFGGFKIPKDVKIFIYICAVILIFFGGGNDKKSTLYDKLPEREKIVYSLIENATKDFHNKEEVVIVNGTLYKFENKDIFLGVIKAEINDGKYVNRRYYIDSSGKAVDLDANEKPKELNTILNDLHARDKYNQRDIDGKRITKAWKEKYSKK